LSAFLLIRHLKYSAPYCQKYTHTDRFFGDFAHWVEIKIKSAVPKFQFKTIRKIMHN